MQALVLQALTSSSFIELVPPETPDSSPLVRMITSPALDELAPDQLARDRLVQLGGSVCVTSNGIG